MAAEPVYECKYTFKIHIKNEEKITTQMRVELENDVR
jgi:hypothetical protein